MTVVHLNGSATDDGLPDPPSALTYLWTKQSGPGTVTFGDATNPITTAVISEPGVYVLRLTAYDSELSGFDEMTVTVNEAFAPPDFDDPVVFGGNIAGYIAWDSTHVVRTWDLQTASPSWEEITGSITGDIWDIQYFIPDEDTVGAWLLGSNGVWLCSDIMAGTPTWTNVLPIATIVAGDAVPVAGTVEPKCMAHYWLEPGHLCVATGPDTNGSTYLHAYFWVTTDYGANWTHVDMSSFTFTSSDDTRCYSNAGLFGMAAFRSAPTIWCVRTTSRTGSSTGRTAVFKSEDAGFTWTMEHEFGDWSADQNRASIHHPYPSITDPMYVCRDVAAGTTPNLYVSTDQFATATEITTLPALRFGGYGTSNNFGMNRINKRTFDNDHIIMQMAVSASSTAELFETEDGGANWTLLEVLGNGAVNPNGWPPDIDQWVLIDEDADVGQHITLTLDNFATLLNRDGDLETVIGTGFGAGSGLGGGFALPKIAPNV